MDSNLEYPILRQVTDDVVIIENELHRATSLWQFRKADGQRRNGMPYWINMGEGKLMWFEQITDNTDVHQLKKDIETGSIWIRTWDVQHSLEVHGVEKLKPNTLST